jgi:Resolvase, N terminal domain
MRSAGPRRTPRPLTPEYGYARVSSNTQDYAAQVDALKAAGCKEIFSEKASGKSTNGRREFDKLMKALLPGDVVVVTKLDRLARSSRDLHKKERGCGFLSLGEAWCDTTTDAGRLMLAIMGGIAEFERGLIRKRCEEGIARAKRKGVTFRSQAEAGPGDGSRGCRSLCQGRDDGRAGARLRRVGAHDMAGAAGPFRDRRKRVRRK